MKSLERRFRNIAAKNSHKSTYVCFAEAVKDQGFSKQTIHRWFQKLVEKYDYSREEKRAILKHLVNLTNSLRTTQNKQETRTEKEKIK